MIGRTLSHYRIRKEISRGGMGIVYQAHDSRLQRNVALKVLPEELVADGDRKLRFVQEARAAAAMTHPNIAVVHEIDDAEGFTFIVMELVEGHTLGALLRQGPLPAARALDIGRQILAGLAVAHAKGIVHRDLKPANVLLLADDTVKIVDFGLAKLVEPEALSPDTMETAIRRQTAAGTLMGTLAYMSPEQARGEPVDHRTDIFSFGALLYEMLEGHPPFERPTPAETLSAILRDSTPPVGRRDVGRIVERCLEKERADRFDSVDQVSTSIETLRTKPPRRQWRPALGAFLLLACLAAGIWWFARRPRTPIEAKQEIVTVLVADFENHTGETVFDGAIEQALAIGLEAAPLVAVYDRSRARQQSLELDSNSAGQLDVTTARLLCQSQGIRLALTGKIQPRDSSYSVEATAIEPLSGERVADAEKTVAEKSDILRAVDQLAAELRTAFSHVPRKTPEQEESFTTASLQAMHDYARARDLLRNGRTEEAIREYEKAVAQDPQFGLAYVGLGAAFHNLNRRDRAREHLEKALTLIHRMTDRERLQTRGDYQLLLGDYAAAIEEYRTLVQQYPAAVAGWANLALAHFYSRHFEEAFETGRKAANVYARQSLPRANVAVYATYAGHFDAAVREAYAVIDLEPRDDYGYQALALARLAEGQIDEAAAAYRRLAELGTRQASQAAMGLADIALYQGRLDDANELLGSTATDDIEAGRDLLAANKLAAMAEAFLESGNRARALESADKALSLSPSVGVRHRVATVHLRAGDSAGASSVTASLMAGNTESKTHGHLVQAEAALIQGDLDQAIASIQAAQNLADTWLAHLAMARVHLEAGAFVAANSELDACFRRRGEATALFLDDIPSYRVMPQRQYFLGRSEEGLRSAGAAQSYRAFLDIKKGGHETALVIDARRRLAALE